MDKNGELYREVRAFIYRNARAVELALWRYWFEGGPKSDVIDMLAMYQNEDGGFGHALECDNWNPASTPYVTAYAIGLLEAVGFEDEHHPVEQGILRYLLEGKDMDDVGWMFSVPSNNDYPHAPWWNYNPESNKTENLGLSASLSAFILKHLPPESRAYQRALAFAGDMPSRIAEDVYLGDMGLNGYIELAATLRGLEAKIDGMNLDAVDARLHALVSHNIERDMSKWSSYGFRPSNIVHAPDSPYYAENKDIVEAELQYLLDTRPKGGVWGIPWTWYDNMDRYGAQFAVSENYWKCAKAIEKLLFLDNFHKI